MLVIPVIDLRRGIVVHGRAGARATYQPLQSCLIPNVTPLGLAEVFRRRFQLNHLYVAELDAIEGGEPNWHLLRDLVRSGMHCWIDGGIGTLDEARRWHDVLGDDWDPIIALETLRCEQDLARMLTHYGPDRLLVSLDLVASLPRTQVEAWQSWGSRAVGRRLVDMGVRRIVLLDVARVGTGQGIGTLELLRQLNDAAENVQWICGGGIANGEQVRELSEQGCDAVLLASTLHDGRIGPQLVREIRDW